MKKLVRVFARVTGKDGKVTAQTRNIVAADLPAAVARVLQEAEGASGQTEIRAAQVVSDVDGD